MSCRSSSTFFTASCCAFFAVIGTLTGLIFSPKVSSAQIIRPLPVIAPGANIAAKQDLIFRIDLGTIPERPRLLVEVTPTNPNPTMEIEIEVTNWQGLANNGNCVGGGVYDGGPTYTSPAGAGSASVDVPLLFCEPRIAGGFWANGTVDVRVRVLDFGSEVAPAKLDISIHGITQVPTSEHSFLVQPDPGPQTVYLSPSKDTVLYQRYPSNSNGSGQHLWAGQDYDSISIGLGNPIQTWRRLNSLLAFNIVNTVPTSAVVTNANLTLYAEEIVGGGGNVSLFVTAPAASGDDWSAGFDDAPGTEFAGTTPAGFSANWNFRRGTNEPWVTPGGDAAGPAIGSGSITTLGDHTLSTSALTDAVQAMIDTQEDQNGFLLRGPYNPLFSSADRAIRFASAQSPTVSQRPELRIDYDIPGPYSEGAFTSGTVVFIGEGENFRWIYDTDEDDVYVTPINGVCEVTSTANTPDYPALLPYSYTYQGAPGYTGVDCCSWQVDSPQTGTLGTGQAMFFHGIDPIANLPPDSDGDGMRDPCDNCPGVPNGPALGSCIGLQGVGAPCRSNLECGQYEFCSLSQEDADFDLAGDACSVPEPAFGISVLLGSLCLGIRSRRRSV